jgi:hypothetical protein
MDKLETLTVVALTPSVAELKVPSVGDIAVPVPIAPAVSMKYSAPAMLELPVVASLTEAASETEAAPEVGSGVMLIPEVTGPVVSGGAVTEKAVETTGPQLPAASLPWT